MRRDQNSTPFLYLVRFPFLIEYGQDSGEPSPLSVLFVLLRKTKTMLSSVRGGLGTGETMDGSIWCRK